jgi:acyl-CoA reductase-like NAD-dependent aldehyde dehydrogenase
VKQIHNLIGGEWVGGPDTEQRNPARQSEVVSTAPLATTDDVNAAVEAASNAHRDWREWSPARRGTILLDAAELLRIRQDTIAEDLTRAEGKTLAEAAAEVRRAIDIFRYFGSAGWWSTGDMLPSAVPYTQVYTSAESLGVVALITPWNFPIAIPAWKLAPALVSGNCVVVKPAAATPSSVDHLARALVESGLPPGVLNVLNGSGSVVGSALAQHESVAAISFTGSTAVGQELRRIVGERAVRLQLEMGGKNAYLVLEDASIAQAASVIASGAFGATGQACTATSRVYVASPIKDAFISEFRRCAGAVRPGDGLDPSTTMGPVATPQQLARNLEAIQSAIKDGFDPGERLEGPIGLVMHPAVISEAVHESALAREEVFGPVVAVVEVSGYEDGLAKVNDSAYGLVAGLATRDIGRAFHFARHAQAGVVKVNRPTTGLDLNVPFGGIRDSSTNTYREQGARALEFFTWSKSVYMGYDMV